MAVAVVQFQSVLRRLALYHWLLVVRVVLAAMAAPWALIATPVLHTLPPLRLVVREVLRLIRG